MTLSDAKTTEIMGLFEAFVVSFCKENSFEIPSKDDEQALIYGDAYWELYDKVQRIWED